MTETLTVTAAAAAAAGAAGPDAEDRAGCGCCQPHPPLEVAEEVTELQARRAVVERRLAAFGMGARP